MRFGADAAATSSGTSPSALPFDLNAALSPLWAGFIMGLTGYTLARAMDIPANKAAGLGVALGATLAVGEIGSSWLKGYLAKATAPAPASTTPVTLPVTPAAAPVGRW